MARCRQRASSIPHPDHSWGSRPPTPCDGLASDVLGGTAKAMPHVRSLSFSTALYFKAPPSFASRCFLPCTIKHKSSHKKHAIKMWETQFLLCTTLGNYNHMSPLFLNKLNIQSSNKRCGRCGNKLSHFLHPALPHLLTELPWTTKFPLKHQDLVPSGPHIWAVA